MKKPIKLKYNKKKLQEYVPPMMDFGGYFNSIGSGAMSGAEMGAQFGGNPYIIGAGALMGGIMGGIKENKNEKQDASMLQQSNQDMFNQHQQETQMQRPAYFANGGVLNYGYGFGSNLYRMGGNLYENGGITGKKVINIEKGELEVDPKTGKVIRNYDTRPPHPEEGIDPRGNVEAGSNNFIIPKNRREEYLKAVKSNDRLRQNALISNIQKDKEKKEFKEQEIKEKEDEKMMKKGGWIKSAINPSHKGWCTPLSNPHCTGHRRALAIRFKHGDLHKHNYGGIVQGPQTWQGLQNGSYPMNNGSFVNDFVGPQLFSEGSYIDSPVPFMGLSVHGNGGWTGAQPMYGDGGLTPLNYPDPGLVQPSIQGAGPLTTLGYQDPALVQPPGSYYDTNIFNTKIPAHQQSYWNTNIFNQSIPAYKKEDGGPVEKGGPDDKQAKFMRKFIKALPNNGMGMTPLFNYGGYLNGALHQEQYSKEQNNVNVPMFGNGKESVMFEKGGQLYPYNVPASGSKISIKNGRKSPKGTKKVELVPSNLPGIGSRPFDHGLRYPGGKPAFRFAQGGGVGEDPMSGLNITKSKQDPSLTSQYSMGSSGNWNDLIFRDFISSGGNANDWDSYKNEFYKNQPMDQMPTHYVNKVGQNQPFPMTPEMGQGTQFMPPTTGRMDIMGTQPQLRDNQSGPPFDQSRITNPLQQGMTAAPSLYDLAKGTFDKPYQYNARKYMMTNKLPYRDVNFQPINNAISQEGMVSRQNAANASGGSGGAFLSNNAQIGANTQTAQADALMKAQQYNNQNRQGVDQYNFGQDTMNKQLQLQIEQMNQANKAKGSEYVGRGLEGLSGLTQQRMYEKNQQSRDQQYLPLFQYLYPTLGQFKG